MKLDKYLVDLEKLKKYGFKKDGNNWVFSKKEDSMNIIITLDDEFENMSADVYDAETKEEYLPFYANEKSTYAANIAQKVDDLESNILKNCFTENDIEKELFDWCTEKWPDRDLNTWEKFPKYVALKDHKTGKWFVLFANVKLSSLDKKQFKSDQEVWVIDLKLDDKVADMIDHKTYFPAFHMNKDHWISILLDNNVNLDVVKRYIEESYENATN